MSEATMGTVTTTDALQAALDSANARIAALTAQSAPQVSEDDALLEKLKSLGFVPPEKVEEAPPPDPTTYLHLADGSVVKSAGTMTHYKGQRVMFSAAMD